MINFIFTLLAVLFVLWALACVLLFTKHGNNSRYCKYDKHECKNKKCKDCKING